LFFRSFFVKTSVEALAPTGVDIASAVIVEVARTDKAALASR